MRKFENSDTTTRCWDMYYATVGLLLTTTENYTILKLHEEFLLNVINQHEDFYGSPVEIPDVFFQNEVRLVQHLLSSTNNRLNKSSSLWVLYRKLYVLSREIFPSVDIMYLNVCMESAWRHPSNYYCWNTIRWISDLTTEDERLQILSRTKKFCFQNVRDNSSWYTYMYIVCAEKDSFDFGIHNARRLSNNLGLTGAFAATEGLEEIFDVESEMNEVREFIDSVQAVEWAPFLCLLGLTKKVSKGCTPSFLKKWRLEVSQFESQRTSIELKRGYPIVPKAYEEDALLTSSYRSLGYKRRFISIFEE